MPRIVLLYTTLPDAASAERIARLLMEKRLAACANILPGARSIFRWKGSIDNASEALMFVKTSEAAAKDAVALISAEHPYETPAISAYGADDAATSSETVAWILSETGAAD